VLTSGPLPGNRDPALRFLALLQGALACGRAHVANRRGTVPDESAVWSWHRSSMGRPWVPLGTRIGWVAGSDLFLEPTASYLVAQALAGAERVPVSEQSLRRSLRERGLLASIDAGRQMVLVRRTLEGSPRQVLHTSEFLPSLAFSQDNARHSIPLRAVRMCVYRSALPGPCAPSGRLSGLGNAVLCESSGECVSEVMESARKPPEHRAPHGPSVGIYHALSRSREVPGFGRLRRAYLHLSHSRRCLRLS